MDKENHHKGNSSVLFLHSVLHALLLLNTNVCTLFINNLSFCFKEKQEITEERKLSTPFTRKLIH